MQQDARGAITATTKITFLPHMGQASRDLEQYEVIRRFCLQLPSGTAEHPLLLRVEEESQPRPGDLPSTLPSVGLLNIYGKGNVFSPPTPFPLHTRFRVSLPYYLPASTSSTNKS